MIKLNRRAKYEDHGSLRFKVIARTHRQTHRQTHKTDRLLYLTTKEVSDDLIGNVHSSTTDANTTSIRSTQRTSVEHLMTVLYPALPTAWTTDRIASGLTSASPLLMLLLLLLLLLRLFITRKIPRRPQMRCPAVRKYGCLYSASEVTTIWRYTNVYIIIIITMYHINNNVFSCVLKVVRSQLSPSFWCYPQKCLSVLFGGNKKAFNARANCSGLSDTFRMSGGSLFHRFGPATEKPRRPNLSVLARGTTIRSPWSVERSRGRRVLGRV